MGFRRRARELAMQALYYVDIRGGNPDNRVALFRKLYSPPEKSKAFFTELVDGVLRHRTVLDTIIEGFSSHWKISRMSCVDRNILRIAAFEILARDDIPVKVSINEAIDIGKKYGTEDSGAFINGILDSIHLAWNEGQITFEPVIGSDQVKDRREDLNRSDEETGSNEETVVRNRRREGTIEPARAKRRSIRLAPGLRKRIVTEDKETQKKGGEYDS